MKIYLLIFKHLDYKHTIGRTLESTLSAFQVVVINRLFVLLNAVHSPIGIVYDM